MLPRRLAGRVLASHLVLVAVAVLFGGLALGGVTDALVGIGIALTGLAIGLSLGLARTVTRPLDRLARAVRTFAAGERAGDPDPLADRRAGWEARVPPTEELAGLTDSLGTMAAELRRRIDDVEGERDRAAQILGALDHGVLLLDREGGLRYANPAARRWFGIGEFTPGAPAMRVLGETAVARLARRVLDDGEVAEREITLLFPERRTLSARATELTERGETAGVVVTLVDLTSRRRLEVLRRDFVANASHELKTPVAAIRALTESVELSLPDDPGTARAFMLRIGSEAERLERLVRDLLDLSKVERATLALETVDLTGLAKEVGGRYAARAAERGIELELELEPGLTMRGDRPQLELLLSNLVDNAVRYTEPGGRVILRVRPSGTDAVEIEVADNGMGIPTADLTRVFERFYRVDKARGRDTGGTGLGLAIVRHVAETHGGRVTVRSELGRGSTFTAILPVNPAA